jgi:lysophospholipase L1-like esterase
MRKLFFILITILSFAQLSYAQTMEIEFANLKKYEEQNKSVSKPKAILLGNSITEGWVGNMPDFFVKNNYVGRGISGQTSAQVLLRFRQDVIDLKPQILVINIGINDIANNNGPYSEKFTLDNIESMIEIAKSNKIKVILASVTPAAFFAWRLEIQGVGNSIISLNNGLKSLSKKHKIAYLDYHAKLKNAENGLDKELAEDGLHPTMKCYEIMAEMVKKAINNVK